MDRSNASSEKAKVMLRSLGQLYGKKLGASDGDIGHVRDFYFNDQQWTIRYVVADTGSWLSGRLVLISPHVFENLHQSGDCLLVNLTRQQIKTVPRLSRTSQSRYNIKHTGTESKRGAWAVFPRLRRRRILCRVSKQGTIFICKAHRLLAATPSKPAKGQSAMSLILSSTTRVGRFVTWLLRPAIGILAKRS